MDSTTDRPPLPTASPSTEEAAMRLRILKVAKANLMRYGLAKTTVVDIARDLGMSHSNVYRFFRTKADILDAVIEGWLTGEEEAMTTLAAGEGSAGERLERLLLAQLARKRAKYAVDAELNELYWRILAERPAAVARHSAAVLGVFARIIGDGVRDGEFATLDAAMAALVVRRATAGFFTPEALRRDERAGSEDEVALRAVIRTLVAGFANRAHPPMLALETPEGTPPRD
jgi:AcrR family transcriptional regulator